MTLALTSGCLGPDGSIRDTEGNVLTATPEEVREAQETLLTIDSSDDMLPSMKGGVLFDGEVEGVADGVEGSTAATLRVIRVIAGPFAEGDNVRVQTPSVERGGVSFVKGRRFRVFAVELDGELRTWSSTGTVEIGG